MIQLDFRSRTKNPTTSVVRNPIPTPPKNLRLLATPTTQPWFEVRYELNEQLGIFTGAAQRECCEDLSSAFI